MNTPVDSNGVFNLMLGSANNPLPGPSAMDRPIWLGVAIDNGPELRPLSQITASAYAINVADNAITSQKIAAGAVQSANLADSAVTSTKLNMDYVSSISVNGHPITLAMLKQIGQAIVDVQGQHDHQFLLRPRCV